MLALGYHWRVRCGGCGHRGEISAPVADLTNRRLRCGRGGHRQTFAPESAIAPQRARKSKRRALVRRGPAAGVSETPPEIGSPAHPVFNDPLTISSGEVAQIAGYVDAMRPITD